MKRRQFIKTSIAGGVTIGLCGAGAVWLGAEVAGEHLTIDAALNRLGSLSGKTITNTGEWNPGQIFTHCAQSVEYSLTGFPVHKSRLFKNSAGQIAFSFFSYRGEMMHGLSNPIPGAPPLGADDDVEVASIRLKTALLAFKHHDGDLAPHFAYGKLSKRDYEIAHVIHFYNHLQEIRG